MRFKIKCFCNKESSLFLEKQNMVELTRSIKNSNINVTLKESEAFNNLIEMKILDEDLNRCFTVRKLIPRIRSLKLETLQKKVFGYDEVSKWED